MENYGDGGAGSEFQPILIQLALLCTVVGSCISFFSVWLHWKNYRKPVSYKYTVKITGAITTFIHRINKDRLFVSCGCKFISYIQNKQRILNMYKKGSYLWYQHIHITCFIECSILCRYISRYL